MEQERGAAGAGLGEGADAALRVGRDELAALEIGGLDSRGKERCCAA